MRQETAAKDRALGSAHSWQGAGAGREGVQEERGVVPSLLPLSQCRPASTSRSPVNRAEELALKPAHLPDSSQ